MAERPMPATLRGSGMVVFIAERLSFALRFPSTRRLTVEFRCGSQDENRVAQVG